ncbi:hypothetical protein ACFLTE_09475 [Bacteroidota bacterium]
MTGTFYCKECDKTFTTEGTKVEYNDPVFGPCASYRANCPTCGADCSEYVKPKQQKTGNNDDLPPCGNPNMTCCRN